MRHGKKFNHLSRTSSHRKAMFANMASSLIIHKRIKTTVPKAKALRIYVEPLITKSKDDSTHSRRIVFSYLQNKEAVSELFREISVKVAERPGGYTRILKIGNRLGDNAEMCLIELVDYNENLLTEKSAKVKKTRRGRRGSTKKTTDESVIDTSTADKTETTEVTDKVDTEVKDQDAEPSKDGKAEEIKPAEDKAEKPAEDAIEKPSEEKSEKPAEDKVEKPVENKVEKPVEDKEEDKSEGKESTENKVKEESKEESKDEEKKDQ